jgi:hypothetical protein
VPHTVGELTLVNIAIFEVDGDPTLGGGVEAPVGSLALSDAGGIWQKQSTADTGWAPIKRKSGRMPAVAFSGSPRTATVVFDSPFADNNYEVFLGSSSDVRSLTYESKTTTGFVINTNASRALLGEISWSADYDI